MDLAEHLKRQIAFSSATFGPGERRAGVLDHIRKEIVEIERSDGSPKEWVDVVILALDGLWRSMRKQCPDCPNGEIAYEAAYLIMDKQDINERRLWPDWRTASPDQAIEHVREES